MPRCKTLMHSSSRSPTRLFRCVRQREHPGDCVDAWGRKGTRIAEAAGEPPFAKLLRAAIKVLAALDELELQVPGSQALREIVDLALAEEQRAKARLARQTPPATTKKEG